MLLSAALIVRDEERHLEDCLRSVQDFVDEIVVVDTGSKDRTVGIAQRFGAQVLDYAWHDDFAAARNFGLEHCCGRWVLYIDADERARPASRDGLASVLTDRLVGCNVLLHAHSRVNAYRELRVFRNDPRIRFEGLIHETIWPGIHRYQEEQGGDIGDIDLVLDHVGYDGPQDHKHRRNLPLLLKALEVDPNHAYCWYHLGMTYLGMGEKEKARESWEQGTKVVMSATHRRPADALAFVELIRLLSQSGEDAAQTIADARRLFPQDPMLEWLEANSLLQNGRTQKAIEVFMQLARRKEEDQLGDAIGYDERFFDSVTYGAIGTGYYKMGDFSAACRYFAIAAERDPENLEYRAKLRLCEHLQDGD